MARLYSRLRGKGRRNLGQTRDEALGNIREVGQMVIESMLEDGEALPPGITQMDEPVVAVTL